MTFRFRISRLNTRPLRKMIIVRRKYFVLDKNEREDTVGTCALLGNLEVTSCENDPTL